MDQGTTSPRARAPCFVFLWIPSRAENEGERNEVEMRQDQCQSIVNLLRHDSPVECAVHTVYSLQELLQCLIPRRHFLPVFILLGHGAVATGAMRFWDDSWLEMGELMKRWAPQFRCDLIATQCGANAFVSYFAHPVLLYYRNVRFIAAAEVNADRSWMFHRGPARPLGMHAELTKVMIDYLRVHDSGGNAKGMREATAFVSLAKRRKSEREKKEREEKELARGRIAIPPPEKEVAPTSWLWRALFLFLWFEALALNRSLYEFALFVALGIALFRAFLL